MSQPKTLSLQLTQVMRVCGTLFFVNVVQTAKEIPDEVLCDYRGTYIIFAETREQALAVFNYHYPLPHPENYEITCMRITPKGGYGGE